MEIVSSHFVDICTFCCVGFYGSSIYVTCWTCNWCSVKEITNACLLDVPVTFACVTGVCRRDK